MEPHRWRGLHRRQLRPTPGRAHRGDGHRAGQADLRRQPRGARRAAPRPGAAGRGRVAEARDVEPLVGRARRRSTSPPSPTTTTPSTIRRRSCGPTWSARSRSWRRSVGPNLHHVSTEVYGDLALDDLPASTSRRPTPREPPSATKAGADHLVRAWVRSFGVDATLLELLEQLRPLAARREVHPAPDHRCSRGVGRGLRRRTNVRDWIHVEDHSSAVLRILTQGVAGETYLVGADGELDNLAG